MRDLVTYTVVLPIGESTVAFVSSLLAGERARCGTRRGRRRAGLLPADDPGAALVPRCHPGRPARPRQPGQRLDRLPVPARSDRCALRRHRACTVRCWPPAPPPAATAPPTPSSTFGAPDHRARPDRPPALRRHGVTTPWGCRMRLATSRPAADTMPPPPVPRLAPHDAYRPRAGQRRG